MRVVRALLLGGFLISISVASCQMWVPPAGGSANAWAWLSVALAFAGTIAAETRDLPLQNVILAAAVIGGAGTVGAMFCQLAIVETVHQGYAMAGREAGFGLGFLASCGMWVVMILNARGVAKVLLQPWRCTANYGVWMLLSTALLVMGLEVGAFATNRRSAADATHPITIGPGNLWVHLTVWTAVTLVTLAVATPILINKSGVQRRSTFQPVVIWLAVGLVLLADAALLGVWWVVGLLGGTVALLLIRAIRTTNEHQ
jgi:hypothetical protein